MNEELEEGEVAIETLESDIQDELKSHKDKKKTKKSKNKPTPNKGGSPPESFASTADTYEKIEKKLKVEGKPYPRKNKNEFTSSTYKTKPCEFFRKGACQKGDDCTFSHEIVGRPDVVCKFFLTGNCGKGDSCPFSHDLKKYPCKYFWGAGNCNQGINCRFSHEPLTDRQKAMDFIEDNEAHFMNMYQSMGKTNLGNIFLDYLQKKAEQSKDPKAQNLLLAPTQDNNPSSFPPPPQQNQYSIPPQMNFPQQNMPPRQYPNPQQQQQQQPQMYPGKQQYHDPNMMQKPGLMPTPPNQNFQNKPFQQHPQGGQFMPQPGQNPQHMQQQQQHYQPQSQPQVQPNPQFPSQSNFNPQNNPPGPGAMGGFPPHGHGPPPHMQQNQPQMQPQMQHHHFQPQHQQHQQYQQPPHQYQQQQQPQHHHQQQQHHQYPHHGQHHPHSQQHQQYQQPSHQNQHHYMQSQGHPQSQPQPHHMQPHHSGDPRFARQGQQQHPHENRMGGQHQHQHQQNLYGGPSRMDRMENNPPFHYQKGPPPQDNYQQGSEPWRRQDQGPLPRNEFIPAQGQPIPQQGIPRNEFIPVQTQPQPDNRFGGGSGMQQILPPVQNTAVLLGPRDGPPSSVNTYIPGLNQGLSPFPEEIKSDKSPIPTIPSAGANVYTPVNRDPRLESQKRMEEKQQVNQYYSKDAKIPLEIKPTKDKKSPEEPPQKETIIPTVEKSAIEEEKNQAPPIVPTSDAPAENTEPEQANRSKFWNVVKSRQLATKTTKPSVKSPPPQEEKKPVLMQYSPETTNAIAAAKKGIKATRTQLASKAGKKSSKYAGAGYSSEEEGEEKEEGEEQKLIPMQYSPETAMKNFRATRMMLASKAGKKSGKYSPEIQKEKPKEKPKDPNEEKYFNKTKILEKLGLSQNSLSQKKVEFNYDMDKLFSVFEFHSSEKGPAPTKTPKELAVSNIKDTLSSLKELLVSNE